MMVPPEGDVWLNPVKMSSNVKGGHKKQKNFYIKGRVLTCGFLIISLLLGVMDIRLTTDQKIAGFLKKLWQNSVSMWHFIYWGSFQWPDWGIPLHSLWFFLFLWETIRHSLKWNEMAISNSHCVLNTKTFDMSKLWVPCQHITLILLY